MSELALDYYSERADRLDLGHLPSVLDGTPVEIFEADQVVSVHQSELATDSPTVRALNEILRSTHRFILDGTSEDEMHPKQYVDSVAKKNSLFSTQVVGKLLVPSAIKTGKIDGVQIEAVAREEVSDAVLRRIKASSYSTIHNQGNPEDAEVYFGLTGRLRSGSRKIIVGGILLARAIHPIAANYPGHTSYATAVHHEGTTLRSTEVSGKLLQREGRAISHIVTEHNMRTAYSNAPSSRRKRDNI